MTETEWPIFFLLLLPKSVITMLTLSAVDPTSRTLCGEEKWGSYVLCGNVCACVITASCVVLQLDFSGYIGGKLLMLVFSGRDPPSQSSGVSAVKVWPKTESKKKKPSTLALHFWRVWVIYLS